MQDTQGFFDKAALQEHPLRALVEFLEQERNNEIGKHYDKLRFVGYVLDIGYETVTIITSDPFKTAVGGVPRNSLLIMVPANLDGLPPHFTLLRVLQAAATPLASEVQQTYFELQKKSMPELDVFTQAELQWGALRTGVLGMFYSHPEKDNEVEFSGDLNNFVSAHKYRVYAPTDNLLDLIVNSLVPEKSRFDIGELRMTENRLPLPGNSLPKVNISVTADDFKGTRTALFGKTRLGKSNIVKLIAESIISTTSDSRDSDKVGQVIFDSDGEYANDNPQDGSTSLASAYKNKCKVYAITQKPSTPSKPLKLDFYAQPHASLPVLRTLLQAAGKDSSNYVGSFLSVDLPDVSTIADLPPGERLRPKRKVLIYWSILRRAGYPADIQKLREIIDLNPEFSDQVRRQIYQSGPPPQILGLDGLARELELVAEANRAQPLSSSGSGKRLFDPEDEALLGMLKPVGTTSTGPRLLQPFTKYHSKKSGDFVTNIISEIDQGSTIILDLGNAAPELMSYFSAYLSREIFHHQVDKFSNNKLERNYVQLYFEEAQNLFPINKPHENPIYQRLAKEGAKYHIGMVYSTQSVTTIDKDLLAQTENFFIAHMSSQDEVNALAKVNIAFDGLQQDILVTRTLGYIRMLTRSHRFVVPVQARKFQPDTKPNGERTANAAVANPSSNGASIIDGRVPQRET